MNRRRTSFAPLAPIPSPPGSSCPTTTATSAHTPIEKDGFDSDACIFLVGISVLSPGDNTVNNVFSLDEGDARSILVLRQLHSFVSGIGAMPFDPSLLDQCTVEPVGVLGGDAETVTGELWREFARYDLGGCYP
jgi:hypothetical protein